MRAIFIAVGSELLDRGKQDTNSLYVASRLLERGILMDMKMVVGDDRVNLAWAIKNACKRAQVVLVCGGLGPTEDDLTREACAEALKLDLVFREDLVENIRQRFLRRNLDMPEINARQAFVLPGADVLANAHGTAPGQYLEWENCRLVLLPGPPNEMKPMFDQVFEEKIGPLSNYFIYRRSLKFAGIAESDLDARIADIYTPHRDLRTTILASLGVIEVHLLGRAKKSVDEAKVVADRVAEKIKERLADQLITEEDISFTEYMVRELEKMNLTLGLAESCTGGGVASRITDVPGSSAVLLGGVVAYSNDVKEKVLGVDPGTLQRHGAVSRETAREMAEGVRRLTGSAIGVAITGIAGPAGAADGKPVGLVFLHLSADGTEKAIHQLFAGDRWAVRARAVNACLTLIWDYLKERKKTAVPQ